MIEILLETLNAWFSFCYFLICMDPFHLFFFFFCLFVKAEEQNPVLPVLT